MPEWFVRLTETAVFALDLVATVLIVIGAAQALVTAVPALFTQHLAHERRTLWLRFARWLVVGLTFQLAADIVETSIRTDWDSIGRLGAVAVIRTFLNYFLEKDIAESFERGKQGVPPLAAAREVRA